jgi:hypothetical protein
MKKNPSLRKAFVYTCVVPLPPSGASKPLRSTSRRGRTLAMEPGLSIKSGAAIRVVVLPVGGSIPPQCLRDYAALVQHF